MSRTGKRTNLSERLRVRSHVSENNEHVFLTLVCEEFSSSQCDPGSDDTLDSGVVSEVQEEYHVSHCTALLEILLKESGCFHVHLVE